MKEHMHSTLRFIFLLLLLPLITSCIGSGGGTGFAQLRISFHDTKVAGSTISRIDMTVLETQIIDINGNKTVISTQPHSFNLLEVAKNNPVILADTAVVPGIYQQIRLILDSNTTITLTDGTKYPLKVPSGQQTGIKIDGVFSIPAGVFYTLDIDLNPGQSVIYTPGQGYELKPVIAITGSQINSGNFYYGGSYNNSAYVTALQPDGTLTAKTAQYPKYLITGVYVFDGVNHTLQVVPQQVSCPSCSRWENLTMNLFSDVPPATTYNVVTFAADYIDLKDSSNSYYHLFKVPTFDLGYISPAKQFTVNATVPSTIAVGNTIVAQLVPQDGVGTVFGAVDTIPSTLVPSFDFTIPQSEFGGTVKDYILLMAVVPSPNDLTLRSNGTVANIQNVIAQNSKNAMLLHVYRDQIATSPVQVPFIP
jgi:hypothetical protein